MTSKPRKVAPWRVLKWNQDSDSANGAVDDGSNNDDESQVCLSIYCFTDVY